MKAARCVRPQQKPASPTHLRTIVFPLHVTVDMLRYVRHASLLSNGLSLRAMTIRTLSVMQHTMPHRQHINVFVHLGKTIAPSVVFKQYCRQGVSDLPKQAACEKIRHWHPTFKPCEASSRLNALLEGEAHRHHGVDALRVLEVPAVPGRARSP